MANQIDKYFRYLIDNGGSDLHLSEGQPPKIRVHGSISAIEGEEVLSTDKIKSMMEEIAEPEAWKRYEAAGDLDFAYEMDEESRFRCNYLKQSHGYACFFRLIPTKIASLEQLGIPEVVKEFGHIKSGLVLVAGPTGSGKSTTLAAIINQINESRQSNIITIEDPVEFIHKDKKSIVSQREVGKQTESFAHALKAALREDPDVILVGELRDLETIGMALTAAETGHLVFGTLHTSGAPNTINRIIDVFPPEQQGQIRAQIAESLKMVVTQKLFKKKDGSGRIGAFEVMVCNAPIKNLIREAKIHQIPSVMQTAQREGMMTMEKSIEDLIGTGVISNAEKNN